MEASTILSQRETELILLHFLKQYSPDVYALWRLHPDFDDTDEHSGNEWQDVASPEESDSLVFYRRKHMDYLMESKLANLPGSSQGLYPAQPWLAYWALQAADVLGITSQLYAKVSREALVEKLLMCLSSVGQDDERRAREAAAAVTGPAVAEAHGAQTDTSRVLHAATAFPPPSPVDLSRPCVSFSGGAVGQMPHMATSYAACCALAILTDDSGSGEGSPRSITGVSPAVLRSLPRAAMKRWLLSVRNEDGSFRMHWGGESDVRASYCGAVMTRLLRLDEPDTFPCEGAEMDDADDVRFRPVLTPQTALFVARCQTHEGGFACGAYASEAHGAYTQCALASLLLMHSAHLCDLASLRRWLAARQLAYEGGFNGRTNKLVDSCYCHWVGSSHVLLRVAEAHVKALGYAHAQAIEGRPEVPLTAREVCLLHHAQLLDAHGIVCSDDAAWDSEETRSLSAADTTDFFLDASDRVKRRATTTVRTRQQFYQSLSLSSHSSNAPGEAAAPTSDEAFYAADVGDFYFNQRKLQRYVLACCQSKDKGGLMDKPDTAHDTYHTCYSLSGTSQGQNLHYAALLANGGPTSPYLARALANGYVPRAQTKEQAQPSAEGSFGVVLGIPGATGAAEISTLRVVNPIFNLHPRRVLSALSAFGPKSFV